MVQTARFCMAQKQINIVNLLFLDDSNEIDSKICKLLFMLLR
jgi:hypothetical protein